MVNYSVSVACHKFCTSMNLLLHDHVKPALNQQSLTASWVQNYTQSVLFMHHIHIGRVPQYLSDCIDSFSSQWQIQACLIAVPYKFHVELELDDSAGCDGLRTLWRFHVLPAYWIFYLQEVHCCDCCQFLCETLHDCCLCISWRLQRSWMIMCSSAWRIRMADMSYRSVSSASTRCICHSLQMHSRRFVVTDDRQFPPRTFPLHCVVRLSFRSSISRVMVWSVRLW